MLGGVQKPAQDCKRLSRPGLDALQRRGLRGAPASCFGAMGDGQSLGSC